MTDNAMTKRKRTNNDLQNIIQKATDRATRTPLKTKVELRCSGRVSSYCSTSGTHHVGLVIKPNRTGKCFMISGTYSWSFVTQIFCIQ
jgi:hypothetical protein